MAKHKVTKLQKRDWDKQVNKKIPERYNIERQIERFDNYEKKLPINETNKPDVIFNKIYAKKQNRWIHIGYRCTSCDKTYKDEVVLANHKNLCKRINTRDKEIEFMPIQRVMKNGEAYYRWGDTGKLYRKREDAEKQAAAAYASGYKSKDMNNNKSK